MAQQWSVVVIAEGPDNPFDLTSDYLEALRVQGNYDIVATSISPIEGVRPNHNDSSRATPVASTSAKCGDNDNYDGTIRPNDDHYIPTYGELLDGYGADVYAGRGHS